MSLLELTIPILAALWIYTGRALLLGVFGQPAFRLGNVVTRITLGLVITPVVVSFACIISNTLTAALILIGLTDLLLVAALVPGWRKHYSDLQAVGWSGLAALSFGTLCMIIAVFNGPFVEHLSDAWWHMRHVSEILNRNQLGPAYQLSDIARSFHLLMNTLGLDASSYRLQALVAEIGGLTVLQAWYGSTVVICGLLGVSFYFLTIRVLETRVARVAALLAWLLILGGMNTGFRLTGWPAGMGYVFLNLGLLASFGLWSKQGKTSEYLVLLSASVIGMAFFHYAELYILAVGLALLVLVALIRAARNFYHLFALLLVAVAGIGLVWWLGSLAHTPPPVSAVIVTLVIVVCLWGAILLTKHNQATVSQVGILFLVCIAGYIGISWPHLVELFSNTTTTNYSYYSAYIPRHLPGFIDGWLRIPKWEHQLRASLLWTSILAIVISPFLYWRFRNHSSLWLLTLCIGPMVILLSPPLFTLAITLIPPYGGYRIQYLIPTALTIGFAISWGVQLMTDSVSAPIAGYSPDWKRRGVGLLLLILCAAAIFPDFATRYGLIKDRPWAVYSNLNFHWRWADNRRAIKTHTSWRYTKDIDAIRSLTHNLGGTFISDLATSYYIAAETLLRPLVQQAHHSKDGQKYRELFEQLCVGNTSADKFRQALQKPNSGADTNRSLKASYVIVNHDTKNYTAEVNGKSCVGETKLLEKSLNLISENLYKGEYLSVWKL